MHYQHTLKFASKSYFHNFFYVSAILCCFDFYDMVQVSTNTNRLISHYIFFCRKLQVQVGHLHSRN